MTDRTKTHLKRAFNVLLQTTIGKDFSEQVDGLVDAIYDASKEAAGEAIRANEGPQDAVSAAEVLCNHYATQCPEITSLAVMQTLLERERQYVKWGAQDYSFSADFLEGQHGLNVRALEELAKLEVEAQSKEGRLSWFAVLLEEVYEAAAVDPDSPTYYEDLTKELTQVSAVALAMREAIERRGNK